MGHYTGFQVDVEVKEQYIDLAKWLTLINQEKRNSDESIRWEDVVEDTGYDFLRTYLNSAGRAGLIPKCAGGCVKGFEQTYCRFGVKNNRLMFCCNLKNYDKEIQKFTYHVLKPIVKNIFMIRGQSESNGTPSYVSLNDLKQASDPDDIYLYGETMGEDLFQMTREYQSMCKRW
jgi:hypothetical protein